MPLEGGMVLADSKKRAYAPPQYRYLQTIDRASNNKTTPINNKATPQTINHSTFLLKLPQFHNKNVIKWVKVVKKTILIYTVGYVVIIISFKGS
jgi:hypothetical protein